MWDLFVCINREDSYQASAFSGWLSGWSLSETVAQQLISTTHTPTWLMHSKIHQYFFTVHTVYIWTNSKQLFWKFEFRDLRSIIDRSWQNDLANNNKILTFYAANWRILLLCSQVPFAAAPISSSTHQLSPSPYHSDDTNSANTLLVQSYDIERVF